MKRNVRRLLSLVMVFVMICGMIPAAFAASSDDYDWDLSTVEEDDYLKLYLICMSSGEHSPQGSGYTTTCRVCGAEGTRDYYYDDDDHNWVYQYEDEDGHWVWCSDRYCEYYDEWYEEHSHSTYCIYCDYGYGSGSIDDLVWDDDKCYDEDNRSWDHDPEYQYTRDGYDWYQCYYCDEWAWARSGSNIGDDGLVLTTDDNLSSGNTYTENQTIWLEVDASVVDTDGDDISNYYDFKFDWSGDLDADYDQDDGTSSSTAYLDTTRSYCDVTCYVTATSNVYETLYGEVTWYATEGAAIEVEATIYNTNTGYALDELDDEGNTSIEEQIYDAIDALESRYDDYTLESVVFDDVDVTGGYLYAEEDEEYYYNYDLGDVVFYPDEDYVGEAVFPFTAWYTDDDNDDDYVSGTITFDVKEGGSGLGIVYTALAGEEVALDEDDFVEFWEEAYPYGTLDYVRFSSISTSKGKLYDAYDDQITSTTKCYHDPTSSQTALDGLTFVPKSSTVTSVEISFTAYGTTRYSSSSSTPLSGTITILYTAEEVTPIEYLSTGTGSVITLDADDFIDKYKEVMDVKTVSGSSLSIQFLEAPTYGSLYLNYNANSYYNSGTELTDKNILSYTFSGNKNASRSIEDVSYVPGSYSAVGESLTFACYYGSALKFVGTVNFGATDPIAVEYVTAGTTPVTFSSYDFTNASLTSGSLYFGTPSKGTLYRNYANGTGTRVTTYDAFSTSSVSYGSTYSLNTLTYVPAAGYVGVVEIPIYSTYSLLGTQTKGVVKIYVGRNFTDVLGTSSVWAAPYINKLSAQGIVNGTDVAMTKFSPTKTITYGEALKLIMMAAGYPEQAKTGTHWASGYLTRAYYDGLVSTNNIDLDDEVNRDTIATITAKALKLSSASSVNWGIVGPVDSANGYVYALYNAGILAGVNQNGQNYFLGTNYITRAEISKIICMVADYAEKN